MQELTVLTEINDYWPIAVSALAFIMWLLRLEAAVSMSAKEAAALWKAREDDKKAAEAMRSENNELLHELRSDMKTVLVAIGELKGRAK